MKIRNKKTGEIREFDCTLINSSKLSAQNRQRLYWTNIPRVEQPKDKGIFLRHILEKNPKRGQTVRYEISNGQTLRSTKDRMRQANKTGSRQGTYVYFPNAEKTNFSQLVEKEKLLLNGVKCTMSAHIRFIGG